jgi:hypothetical protein
LQCFLGREAGGVEFERHKRVPPGRAFPLKTNFQSR